ncbi:MAG: hypothetical protein LW710_09135 [Burkholderiales bacterium]|jgi:hypothetical protein|uniref:hypothetical protein n=1 Tax=Limnobacter sp. TaxID=2003368 RepID=UPI0039BCE88C|nr:hypothetical protein [Burkholderiales bacterium]
MKQPEITQVLLIAHGWGYNHRFFDALLNELPTEVKTHTLFVCLEAGYFPEQAQQGLMIYTTGSNKVATTTVGSCTTGMWEHYPAEALHSLVLAHAEVPWLGLGHSLGFSKLLNFSVRWHSLFSLHGFTHFTNNRVLARMIRKAEQNMAEVLGDFHQRCGHIPQWATLNEQALLADLRSMQELNAEKALLQALAQGAELHAWASNSDEIVPLALAQQCFDKALKQQNRMLLTLASEHAGIATATARYTDTLLPLLSQH